ncbi:hypothetical protein HJG60_011384 [Phyllostomus discolor]|uniref:Uncharacterized protein n=1 Tax=Phyllostomus discolor TaxID=89673 RepID=A0A834A2T1_9CHIR|nr:hypothetical protein HJG60_011384 [Phyllostomus discolor]
MCEGASGREPRLKWGTEQSRCPSERWGGILQPVQGPHRTEWRRTAVFCLCLTVRAGASTLLPWAPPLLRPSVSGWNPHHRPSASPALNSATSPPGFPAGTLQMARLLNLHQHGSQCLVLFLYNIHAIYLLYNICLLCYI